MPTIRQMLSYFAPPPDGELSVDQRKILSFFHTETFNYLKECGLTLREFVFIEQGWLQIFIPFVRLLSPLRGATTP